MRRSCSVKTHRLHAPLNSCASDITTRRSDVRAASCAAYILPRGGVCSSFRAWRADSTVRPTSPRNRRVPALTPRALKLTKKECARHGCRARHRGARGTRHARR
eukprot:4722671-Prymnesium_polylepis.1